MSTIEIKTLIDVTRTNVVRANQGSSLELDQQRNFTTLIQCAEMRSIVMFESNPQMEKVDIKGLGFGSAYKGKQHVWTFKFDPDRQDVYNDGSGNDLAFLINDLHLVPIIKNLTETVNIDKAVFDCKDNQYKNILITAISGKN
jgi:hypothetical protein